MIFVILSKTFKAVNRTKKASSESSLETNIRIAKNDPYTRNELIRQYQPFILKVTSKVCKRYVDKSQDEFSVALEGFNEAIDHYQPDQGNVFLSFAEMVIRRRVIDYIRKESRQTRDIYLEPDVPDEEEQAESVAQVHLSLDRYAQMKESEKREADILEYRDHLNEFNIDFEDLVRLCPKHRDARENAKQIAKKLASDSEYVTYLLEKKQLPMKRLLKNVQCSRKTLERNRKYIIALSLIYIGQYTSLQSYIEPEEEMKGGK